MKKGLLGLAAMMFGLSASTTGIDKKMIISEMNNNVKKTTSLKGWRHSPNSEYFGRRSEIVNAYTKRGTKQMKLKNALKGNHEFDFITK